MERVSEVGEQNTYGWVYVWGLMRMFGAMPMAMAVAFATATSGRCNVYKKRGGIFPFCFPSPWSDFVTMGR